MPLQTETRNATLEEFEATLGRLQAAKLDAVVPGTAMTSEGGRIRIEGMGTGVDHATVEDILSGAAKGYGTFTPNANAIGHLAEWLRVPVVWLRRMHQERPDIFDDVLNLLLHGSERPGGHYRPDALVAEYPADPRAFFVRTYVDPDGENIMRAMRSPSYRSFENLDLVMTVLEAFHEQDPGLRVTWANLTERRMSFKVVSPECALPAPSLLAGYRSPFGDGPRVRQDGTAAQQGDIVGMGTVVANSEIGSAKLTIDGQATVLTCGNGMTTQESLGKYSRVHMGAKQERGLVRWSEATHKANLALVREMAKDAVREFINPEYLGRQLKDIEEKAATEVSDPEKTIEIVRRELGFTEETRRLVMEHFIRGGQMNAGGVLQAVTSAAQVVADADEGFDMEHSALRALQLAHRAA